MESASKALLIAGAILVVLALISIGIAVATRGGETVEKIGDFATNDALVSNQVNKFLKYEGDVTGAQVKECASIALNYNETTPSDDFKILIDIEKKATPPAPATTINLITTTTTGFNGKSISNLDKYRGEVVEMRSNGTIKKMIFKQI